MSHDARKDMRLVERFPKRHGAAVELLLGSVIVRIEYDASGKLKLCYVDEDENQVQKVWKSDRLKNTDVKAVLGNVGTLLKEVADAIANDPKKLMTEIPAKMKKLLGPDAKEDKDNKPE